MTRTVPRTVPRNVPLSVSAVAAVDVTGLTGWPVAQLLHARSQALRYLDPAYGAIQAEVNRRCAGARAARTTNPHHTAPDEDRLLAVADPPNPFTRLGLVVVRGYDGAGGQRLEVEADTCCYCLGAVRRYPANRHLTGSNGRGRWRADEYDETGRCITQEQRGAALARTLAFHEPLAVPDPRQPFSGPSPTRPQATMLRVAVTAPGTPPVNGMARRTANTLLARRWLTARFSVTERGLAALYGARWVVPSADTVARLAGGPLTVRERHRARAMFGTASLTERQAQLMLAAEPGGAPGCGGRHDRTVLRCAACGHNPQLGR